MQKKSSLSNLAWKHPPKNTLKLNVDGVVFANQEWAGMGCVLKNGDGTVFMAATNPEQFYNTPLEVEFITIF